MSGGKPPWVWTLKMYDPQTVMRMKMQCPLTNINLSFMLVMTYVPNEDIELGLT